MATASPWVSGALELLSGSVPGICQRTEARRAAGICVRCPRPVAIYLDTLCPRCATKKIESQIDVTMRIAMADAKEQLAALGLDG